VPSAQHVLRAIFLEPFKYFRYNVEDPSKQMPLSSGFSQVLLISLYLATVLLARRYYHGVLKVGPPADTFRYNWFAVDSLSRTPLVF
jgi:hypothetical protein